MSPFDQIQMSPFVFRGNHGRGGTDEFERSGPVRGDPAGDPAHHGPVRRCAVAQHLGAASQTAGARHPPRWRAGRSLQTLGCSQQPADFSSGTRPICRLGARQLQRLWPDPGVRVPGGPARLHRQRRDPAHLDDCRWAVEGQTNAGAAHPQPARAAQLPGRAGAN